jgi:hypothetical protein
MMTSSGYLVGGAVILALLSGAVVAAGEKPNPLTVTLSAQMAAVRREVVVRARVEPDARSRELTIEWVADDLSGGSHAISLNGARAAATHRYAPKGLSPGKYEVTAILRLSDGTEIRRRSNLLIVGIGGPEGVGATQGRTAGSVRPASQP